MVNDVRALKTERIVVIIEMDGVVLLVEAHNHAIGRVQLSVYPSFCLKGLMHDE